MNDAENRKYDKKEIENRKKTRIFANPFGRRFLTLFQFKLMRFTDFEQFPYQKIFILMLHTLADGLTLEFGQSTKWLYQNLKYRIQCKQQI